MRQARSPKPGRTFHFASLTRRHTSTPKPTYAAQSAAGCCMELSEESAVTTAEAARNRRYQAKWRSKPENKHKLKLYRRKWRVYQRMKPPQNVSKAVRRLNPHIYGAPKNDFVGALPEPKRQSHPIPALDQSQEAHRSGKGSLGVLVTLISCRHKLLDDDNLAYSLKGLRDAVAKSIGIDDADRRVRWQYGQCETHGEQGTIVTIETL